MKIVVAGGSGLIGSRIVGTLRARGHEAVVACRSAGIDAATGVGLYSALEDAAVVVDATDSPSRADDTAKDFFRTSTRNLLAAGWLTGVRHHVLLSVVGADELGESGYVRAKMDQERLVAESGLPYSIVRSTQVLESIPKIADAATHAQTVRVPPVRVQPIAVADLAAAVSDLSMGVPINGIVEVAGPDTVRLDELVRNGLSGRNDPRTVVAEPAACYLGARLTELGLFPSPGATLGTTRLLDWLGHDASCHRTYVTDGRQSDEGCRPKVLRDRIDPRFLRPEVLIDALVEWPMHPDDGYAAVDTTESSEQCETSLRAEQNER